MSDKETIVDNKTFNAFHSLVKDLSDYEKNNLLSKLMKFSDYNIDDSQNITKKGDSSADIDKINKFARKSFAKFGIFRKFFTYLVALFNGSSVEEVIIHKELNYLKNEMEFKYSKYIKIQENKLRPYVLEKIVPLMGEINMITSTLENFFESRVSFFEFVVFVIENENFSELSEELNNLSPENLDNKPTYLEKNNYISEKEKRIKSLFNKVTSSKYYEINKELIKLDFFLKFVEYDFTYLTNLFNYSNFSQPFSTSEEIYITKDVISYIERLYRLLISVDTEILQYKIFSIFLSYLDIYFEEDPDKEEKKEAVKNAFVSLVNMIYDLKTYLPYETLVKYITGDILKVIRPYQLSINIVEMYKAYKRTFIDKLWESSYVVIKSRNITLLVNELFGEYNFNSLSFFDKNLIDRLEKYSGLKVKDFYLLNILYRFIETIYNEKIYPVVNKILIDGIFTKDIVKSNFSTAYYSLKSGLDKINLFDIQYKEDTQLRKKINNTLIKISSEANFKSILFNTITDINEETFKIKFEIIESLKILQNTFKSIDLSDTQYTKMISNLADVKLPIYPNHIIAVEKINNYLAKFMNVYALIEESF